MLRPVTRKFSPLVVNVLQYFYLITGILGGGGLLIYLASFTQLLIGRNITVDASDVVRLVLTAVERLLLRGGELYRRLPRLTKDPTDKTERALLLYTPRQRENSQADSMDKKGYRMVLIRKILESDAGAFLALCKQLDEENKFMLLEPGERKTTLEEQEKRIREILSHDNQTIFVAEEQGSLLGYLAAIGGSYARNRHEVYIVVGILEAFTSRGIGTALFEALDAWAREHNIHRLELSVMVHNTRGVGLYQKMGFQIEGIKKDSLLVDGVYVDEYYMGKILVLLPGFPPKEGRSVSG